MSAASTFPICHGCHNRVSGTGGFQPAKWSKPSWQLHASESDAESVEVPRSPDVRARPGADGMSGHAGRSDANYVHLRMEAAIAERPSGEPQP